MNIVIDARLYSTTTGRVVREFLDRLPALDPNNDYYVLLLKKDIESFEPGGLNIHAVEADIPYYSFAEQLRLPSLLSSLKPDLVHFMMPQQPLRYSGKTVTMVHDLTLIDFPFKKPIKGPEGWYRNHIKPFVFTKIIGRIINDSDLVISPSDYVTDQIKQRYQPKKAITVYNGTSPLTEEDPEPLAGYAAPFICYVGNLFPYKNLKNLIRALPTIRIHVPHLELVIVGKENEMTKQLQAWIDDQEIDGVRFTGFVGDTQLRWLYLQAKALVHPSKSEGFGLTGLEAMHEGAVVASSDATCLPEVYGEAALFFDPDNQEDIAEKVVQVVTDETLRARLKSASEERIKKYSWDDMSERYVEVYRELLS